MVYSGISLQSPIISLSNAGSVLCAGSDDGHVYMWKDDSYKQGAASHGTLKIDGVESVNCIAHLSKDSCYW